LHRAEAKDHVGRFARLNEPSTIFIVDALNDRARTKGSFCSHTLHPPSDIRNRQRCRLRRDCNSFALRALVLPSRHVMGAMMPTDPANENKTRANASRQADSIPVPKQIRFVNNQGQPPSKRRRISAA
jgi:hypothetical protein